MSARPGRTRCPRSRWIPLALALALLAGSCTPAPRGPAFLDLRALATRYEAQRADRGRRAQAARIEATAWVDAASLGRLPALDLDVALVAPDRVRARAASLFGTAVDLLVNGDSLTAYVPPKKLGVQIGSLQDSLGIRRPGDWACRALAASWDPGDVRWGASDGDSLRRAAWVEDGDSLVLDVDARALPAALAIRPASGRTLRVRYTAWQWIGSIAWPARIEIEDPDADVEVALRIDRVRFEPRPDPQWLALTVPASARHLDWPALREALARVGGGR